MRDALIFLIVFGSLPFIFKRPALGVLMFTWLSLMNPHRLAYGAAFDFPFAAIVAGFTAVSLFLSAQPKRFPKSAVTFTMLLFATWMTVTSFFALEPLLVWREWDRVIKTLFMVVISITALNTEKDLKNFVWVVALSLGIYGLKGGIFTIITGGNFKVYGPSGSYIAENNSMALALVTVLPLIWYLHSQVKHKYIALGVVVVVVCTAIAAVGSYSRGALIGGAAMFFFLWYHGPKKVQTAVLVIAVGALISVIMPEQWFQRMNTIDDYQQDSSAMGRINAWHFAVNVATNHLVGGGFNVFTPHMFKIYAPEPDNYHVAHSIYFQVLGDHGFFGLTIFLLLMFFAWRTGTRIATLCKDDQDRKWASDLARMAQVSLIGFAVSGAFLSLAYFDLYYDIIIILVVLEKILLLPTPKTLLPVSRSRRLVT